MVCPPGRTHARAEGRIQPSDARPVGCDLVAGSARTGRYPAGCGHIGAGDCGGRLRRRPHHPPRAAYPDRHQPGAGSGNLRRLLQWRPGPCAEDDQPDRARQRRRGTSDIGFFLDPRILDPRHFRPGLRDADDACRARDLRYWRHDRFGMRADGPFDAAHRAAKPPDEAHGGRQHGGTDGDRPAHPAIRGAWRRVRPCRNDGNRRRDRRPDLPADHRHRSFGVWPDGRLAPGAGRNNGAWYVMKIIQVQTQAEAAGAQRISDMVGEGLRARGHEVRTVFMYRKTPVYDQDPYADFILRQPPRGIAGQLRAASGLIAYLRRARPDAVISYQHYGNVFGTIGGWLAGARYMVANQSGAPQRKGMPGIASLIDKWMGSLGLYHANVVNSAWTEAQFADYPASYRRRIRRIDHGVAGPRQIYEKKAARAAFNLPPDAWLAVSTGRLSPQKNHIALVGALPRLAGLHVAIAGAGPEHDRLVAFAQKHKVADRLHFVGEVEPARIFEFLAAGDVFVFPSTNETFGLSAAEAAI